MKEKDVQMLYYDWLCAHIGEKTGGYSKLLEYLYARDFTYIIPLDGNRAADGIDLRYNFGREKSIADYIIASYLDHRPCSILEMMVALATRCEVHIMDNPEYGNRTSQWFWEMVQNLGLSKMTDGRFRHGDDERIINRFLDREYGPDGSGGLFTVGSGHGDMRSVEIWYQMEWYLDRFD